MKKLSKEEVNEVLNSDDRGEGFVYFVLAKKLNLVKIGTSIDPYKRFSSLESASPDSLEMIAIIPGGSKEEQNLHKKFFDLRDHLEWFRYEEPLVDFIKQLNSMFTKEGLSNALEQERKEKKYLLGLLRDFINSTKDMLHEHPHLKWKNKKNVPSMLQEFMKKIDSTLKLLEDISAEKRGESPKSQRPVW